MTIQLSRDMVDVLMLFEALQIAVQIARSELARFDVEVDQPAACKINTAAMPACTMWAHRPRFASTCEAGAQPFTKVD